MSPGITKPIRHSQEFIHPILPTVKAVYCWESLAILTCQKSDFRSMVEKNWTPTIDSMVSCIQGRG